MMSKIVRILKAVLDLSIFDLFRLELEAIKTIKNIDNVGYAQQKTNFIINYAYKNCEYYHNVADLSSGLTIDSFPLLNKQIIRANYNQILSKQVKHLWKTEAKTGGSTGEPLKLLRSSRIDKSFQNVVWKQNGYKRGDVILAMDGQDTTNLKKIGNVCYLKSKKQLPYGGIGMSSLYLTDQNIDQYYNDLISIKPSFIRGYPSFIYRLACYIQDNNLPVNFKIKAIEMTSETSLDYQIQLIQKVFNTHVVLQYGHTECCVFAYTFDDTFKYLVEPTYGFVEIIKPDGKKAEIGEVGEIVVTGLYNKAMPLIRYCTGDLGIFGGFANGKMIINTIYGRTQDVIFNRNGDKVYLVALIFAQHNDFFANIVRWQIVQNEIGKIIIKIIKGSKYSDSDEQSVKDLFERLGDVDVTLMYVDSLPITMRGKSMLIIQNVNK